MNTNQRKSLTIEVGTAEFESEVLRSEQPVLVAFWAPWSRPCQILGSAVDEVATACAGSVKVVKVNADDNPDLSMWYDVQSIPTLLYFVDGCLHARIVGTASRDAIISKLRSVSTGSEPESLSPSRNREHEQNNL